MWFSAWWWWWWWSLNISFSLHIRSIFAKSVLLLLFGNWRRFSMFCDDMPLHTYTHRHSQMAMRFSFSFVVCVRGIKLMLKNYVRQIMLIYVANNTHTYTQSCRGSEKRNALAIIRAWNVDGDSLSLKLCPLIGEGWSVYNFMQHVRRLCRWAAQVFADDHNRNGQMSMKFIHHARTTKRKQNNNFALLFLLRFIIIISVRVFLLITAVYGSVFMHLFTSP